MPLTITRLGPLGDAIAETPEGPIYVAMALPGEVVEATGEARIASPKILTPAPERVKAPCPQYRACGGCLLQHASDEFVAGWKARIVEGALAGQGLAGQVNKVETSPLHSRRRATLSARRTKKDVIVGFHARGADTVVEAPDCLLLDPRLLAALPALKEATRIGASRKGEIAFTVTASEGGVDVSAQGGKEMDTALFGALSAVAEQFDLARLAWNGAMVAARRPASQSFGRARVEPPAGSFLQATRAGEASLVAAVRAIVGDAERVLDLFSGAGTFTLPLAELAEVHAVENEAAMLKALDAGWRKAQGLKRISHEVRDLFSRPLLPDELEKVQAIVLDPPRAGAGAQVEQIALSKARRVAYVSCNPVTFARDAKRLVAAGFAIGPITVVDQFRYSSHVELVAGFTR